MAKPIEMEDLRVTPMESQTDCGLLNGKSYYMFDGYLLEGSAMYLLLVGGSLPADLF